MTKPYNIDKLVSSKKVKELVIKFDKNTTYEEVVYQLIQGLTDKNFAPEREIIGGGLDITTLELKKTEGN